MGIPWVAVGGRGQDGSIRWYHGALRWSLHGVSNGCPRTITNTQKGRTTTVIAVVNRGQPWVPVVSTVGIRGQPRLQYLYGPRHGFPL